MYLNCDIGESLGPWKMGLDEQAMPHIDMANIACGFHASDPLTMQKTVALACQHNVTIGAHPGYPDLIGFGRRHIACSLAEIESLILYQIGALSAFCHQHNTQVSYVKPHGALYHDMMRDMSLFETIVRTISNYDTHLALMLLANKNQQQFLDIAAKHQTKLIFEAFADRNYNDDGNLVNRQHDKAVHQDPTTILKQAESIAKHGFVNTLSGNRLAITADTLCVHGDNLQSVKNIKQIRQMLAQIKS